MPIQSLEYETRSPRRTWWPACREWLEALAVVLLFLLTGTAVFYVVAAAVFVRLRGWGTGP